VEACGIDLCEEKRNAYMVLVGKPERKRQLARSRQGLMYNIKIVVEETG
jgi:hypothetical protein